MTGANGAVLLTADGVAATLSGQAAIDTGGTPTNLTDVSIALNSTGHAVNELIGTHEVVVPSGSYLRVAATADSAHKLTIGALNVSGSFVFEKTGTTVQATITDGTFSFGQFTVTGVNGSLSWDGTSFAGNLSGHVAFSNPAVSISGAAAIAYGTSFSVSSPGLSIDIGGSVVTGAVTLAESAGAVTLTLSGGTAQVGAISLTSIAGALSLSSSGGLASTAALSGNVAVSGLGGLSLTGTLSVSVDTTAAAANRLSILATVSDLQVGDVVFHSGASPPTVGISRNSNGTTSLTLSNLPLTFAGLTATISGALKVSTTGTVATLTVSTADRIHRRHPSPRSQRSASRAPPRCSSIRTTKRSMKMPTA